MSGDRAKRFPLALADLQVRPKAKAVDAAPRLGSSAASLAAAARSAPVDGPATPKAEAQARIAAKSAANSAAKSAAKPVVKTVVAKPGGAQISKSASAATHHVAAKPGAARSSVGAAGKSGAQPAATVTAKPPSIKSPVAAIAKPAAAPRAAAHGAGKAAAGAHGSPPSARTAAPHSSAARSAVAASVAGAMRPTGHQGAPQVPLSNISSGALALTSERIRERMVERVRANGIGDPRVLGALSVVPRHLFVDPGLAAQAYEEAALPIGHQQTISKPSVVARMIELVAANRNLGRVLEIGTGCGYQAAVLSRVANEVYSIERIKPLFERAKRNLRPLRVPNIRLHYGDGRVGLPDSGPFDAIVIAAAGLDVPPALLEQLAIGGRLIAPVGAATGDTQVLTLVERTGPDQWRESRLDRVFFVPLKSGVI